MAGWSVELPEKPTGTLGVEGFLFFYFLFMMIIFFTLCTCCRAASYAFWLLMTHQFWGNKWVFWPPVALLCVPEAEFVDWLENSTGRNWLRQETPTRLLKPPSLSRQTCSPLLPPLRCCRAHRGLVLVFSPASLSLVPFLSSAFVWETVVIGSFK